MTDVLVTIATQQRRIDVAMPGEVPLRELIPDLVDTCVDPLLRSPSARWAVGILGADPLQPTKTLDEAGILDGSLLYLRDMTSPVPAPTPPAAPFADAPIRTTKASQLRKTGSELHKPQTRWGVEATALTFGLFVVAAILFAVWIGSSVASNGSAVVGILLALIILGLFTTGIWWMGLGPWVSTRFHIGFMGHLPVPPGLSAHPKSVRNESVDRPTKLTKAFLDDLGSLLSGQTRPLDYMAPAVVTYVQRIAEPMLSAGNRVIPRFSIRGAVQVKHDANNQPTAVATFDDTSSVLDSSGKDLNAPARALQLTLTFDSRITSIVNVALQQIT